MLNKDKNGQNIQMKRKNGSSFSLVLKSQILFEKYSAQNVRKGGTGLQSHWEASHCFKMPRVLTAADLINSITSF
jgi:hypothetical protein